MRLSADMQSHPGPSFHADEPVHRELMSLLAQLSWSYVALWSFSPQSRRLEWRAGHFRVNPSTSVADTEVWNEHLFNSTYKSCTFDSGQGGVGRAHAEDKSIWMNGPSVHYSAGSEEQAEFFQHAKIKTAVCIPWVESVLELGTCEAVAEDLELTAYMRIFLSERILPSLTQAPPNVSQASLAGSEAILQSGPHPSMRLPSESFLNLEVELNSLNEQIRRSSSLSCLDTGHHMYLQQIEEHESAKEDLDSTGLETDIILTDPRWTSFPQTITKAANIQLQTQKPQLRALNQASMSARVQYRSHSGTSSSLSISEEGSVRLSVDDSPERNNLSLMASTSSQRSPENLQIGDTSATATGNVDVAPIQSLRVEDDELQQAISHMLEEGEAGVVTQDQWRNLYSVMNPALDLQPGNVLSDMNPIPSMTTFHARDELPFKLWRHSVAPVLQRNDGHNQALLRRSFDLLNEIHNLEQLCGSDAAAVQDPRLLSNSGGSARREVLPDIGFAQEPFDQTAPPRGERRPREGRGSAAHPGHDEAATNHMMAERRRRIKQKENFAALRKLVPIISKADKASILSDAIAYIKDLQARISELEASRAQTESRYENLRKAHEELEQRNKELEAIFAAGANFHMQQHRSPRLQSWRSSF